MFGVNLPPNGVQKVDQGCKPSYPEPAWTVDRMEEPRTDGRGRSETERVGRSYPCGCLTRALNVSFDEELKMILLRRCRWLWCVFVPAAVVGMGCRDTEPPPAHNRDLGTNGTLLLPTASVWCDPAIAEGQAEWYPFREPQLQPAPAGEAAGTGGERAEAGQIETEIRELIEEYNEVVADGSVDDLLDYFVEEQHDALRPLLEAGTKLAAKLGELRGELEAKMPDAGDRIAAAFGALGGDLHFSFTVELINVVSNAEVTAKLPGDSGISTLRFKLVDEDWYIEFPGLEKIPSIMPKPALDLALATYDGWIQGLQSGQVPPDTVMQQIEVAATAAKAARQATGLDPPAGTGDATAPNDSDADDGTGDDTGGG